MNSFRELPESVTPRPKYDAFLRSDVRNRNRLWLYTSCLSHGCDPDPPPPPSTECQLPAPGSSISPGSNNRYWNGWPGYVIDASASESRAMGWLSFLYDTSGELYFEIGHCLRTAWMSQQFAYDGNGDGTLFYPGNHQIIGGTHDIPIESLRLKLIRDGYEDYEYLKLLADWGQRDRARAIARELFPNMYTTDQSDRQVQAARLQLARLVPPDGNIRPIMASHGPPSPSPH